MSSNPSTARFGAPSAPPEVLTAEEIHRLRAAINTNPLYGLRNRAMFDLILHCGLRKGEATNLRVNNIEIDGDAPHVRIRGSKFGKGRNVPIDLRIIPTLQTWAARRPPSDWFFCTVTHRPANGISRGNPVGTQLSHGCFNGYLSRIARKAGIQRRVWPHMLRHTCATNWLVDDGFPLEAIRILLGHVSIQTTQRYTHVRSNHIDELIYGIAGRTGVNSTPYTLQQAAALIASIDPEPAAERERRAPPAGPMLPVRASSRCPWCAETVQPAAIKCRHCHEMIGDAA